MAMLTAIYNFLFQLVFEDGQLLLWSSAVFTLSTIKADSTRNGTLFCPSIDEINIFSLSQENSGELQLSWINFHFPPLFHLAPCFINFFLFCAQTLSSFRKFLRLVRATAQLWLNFMCREKRDASEWPVYAEKSNATLNGAITARRVEKRLLEAKKKKIYCSCWNCSSLTRKAQQKRVKQRFSNRSPMCRSERDVTKGFSRFRFHLFSLMYARS